MPRANRHSFPGQVWHITHRCHDKQWLLKFNKDRTRWLHWLFKARQRFRLSVLNYMVTSNHIHLLVVDQGRHEIAKSMQLIASRTAQEFNRRKERKGAFWEDRYHATAVQTNHHLHECMTYIDLNMVRAGAVNQPQSWRYCGLYELHNPPQRKSHLDTETLLVLFEQPSVSALAEVLTHRAEDKASAGPLSREEKWSQAVMVGDKEFVQQYFQSSKLQHPGLKVVAEEKGYTLREPEGSYSIHFWR
ncbi:MAG: transposase [Gammaproteobacteria bacterium]|nr:transposase [Gammaproteobacteria bacterium]